MREVPSSLETLWARQSGLFAFLVALIVTGLGFVLDVSLLTEGFPRRDLMFISNLIIGIIAGWLFYQFAKNEKSKRALMQERMRTIADLNHHIRNALQVIRYAGGSKTIQDANQLQLINEAVARIEWALRQVLPRYPQMPGKEQELGKSEASQADFSSAVVDDFILRHKGI